MTNTRHMFAQVSSDSEGYCVSDLRIMGPSHLVTGNGKERHSRAKITPGPSVGESCGRGPPPTGIEYQKSGSSAAPH
jgi:hypothetical protein